MTTYRIVEDQLVELHHDRPQDSMPVEDCRFAIREAYRAPESDPCPDSLILDVADTIADLSDPYDSLGINFHDAARLHAQRVGGILNLESYIRCIEA